MKKSNFMSLDSLSLQEFDENSELIPLMTPEDEEEINKEALPETLPILPLRNTVLFPGVVIPITAGRDKSIKLINDANNGNKMILEKKQECVLLQAFFMIQMTPFGSQVGYKFVSVNLSSLEIKVILFTVITIIL